MARMHFDIASRAFDTMTGRTTNGTHLDRW